MKLYALMTKQGTAMPETLLVDDDLLNTKARLKAIQWASEADDWDTSETFQDVSDNDYLVGMVEDGSYARKERTEGQ